MKVITILLCIVSIAFAKPRKELTKYVLKNKFSLHYEEGTGFKVIYKRYDKINASLFEISSFVKGDDTHYMFATDTLLVDKKSKKTSDVVNFDYLKYSVIEMSRIDSLKANLVRWENRVFTKERLDTYIYQEFAIDSNLQVRLEFLNKQDLYYDVVNSDFQFEKGTNVYVPTLTDVSFVYAGRKHQMSFQEFKRTFEISRNY